MRCEKCFDCHEQYIMLYQNGESLPSLIHVWDLSSENPTLIGTIKISSDLLTNVILDPKFFCMGCNALLPNALPKKEYNEFVRSYKGE